MKLLKHSLKESDSKRKVSLLSATLVLTLLTEAVAFFIVCLRDVILS